MFMQTDLAERAGTTTNYPLCMSYTQSNTFESIVAIVYSVLNVRAHDINILN